MTSVARAAASPPPRAARTRAHAREAPTGRARARPPGRALTLAAALLGGLAGVAAAAVLVALAPAVGRGVAGAADPATLRDAATGRPPEREATSVASVLASAMAAGALPEPDPTEARP
jgi:hypothetical protein